MHLVGFPSAYFLNFSIFASECGLNSECLLHHHRLALKMATSLEVAVTIIITTITPRVSSWVFIVGSAVIVIVAMLTIVFVISETCLQAMVSVTITDSIITITVTITTTITSAATSERSIP